MEVCYTTNTTISPKGKSSIPLPEKMPAEVRSDASQGEDTETGEGTVLHKLVDAHDWAGALARLAAYPSESRVRGVDRRLPLHFACDYDAPAVVIQALLKAYPESATAIGAYNLTPLHIICSSQNASVHVVRVLVECGTADQFTMRDDDGDTPLHTACRCSAPKEVLEVLLRACPEAVGIRDFEGLTPLLRLWVRYVVMLGQDVLECVTSGADLYGGLLEAWNKTELLLRCAYHGSLDVPDNKLFRAVHAACAVDCPRSIVKIATKVYPRQLGEKDEEGRTPLMIACQAPIFKVRDLSDTGYSLEDVVYGDECSDYENEDDAIDHSASSSHPSVIDIILKSHQDTSFSAVGVPDSLGRLPLHVASSTGKGWDDGIKQLVEGYPEAASIQDPVTHLPCFMLAAASDKADLTSIYELLRVNPTVMEDTRHCKLAER